MPAARESRRIAEPEFDLTAAPFGRRLLSLVYEVLLLAALLWCASLLFWVIERQITDSHARAVFQFYIAAVAGVYYVWQWTHGGQTLPMKTWRLKLVAADGGTVSTGRALVRYVAAIVSVALLGLGFIWPLVDRDRQFLHDRLAKTRIVRV